MVHQQICTQCGASNPSHHTFCFQCGAAFTPKVATAGAPAPTGLLQPQRLLKQRYRIERRVGKGGMGAVYLAEDLSLGNRRVAVKEMSQSGLAPHERAEAVDNFRREALLLARLHHPHLPSIYEHFFEDGRWYLVMSFIEGQTLAAYLKQFPSTILPLEEVLSIGIQLCIVLDYLHTHQPPIIFRDLKPSNIMRTSTGHLLLVDN